MESNKEIANSIKVNYTKSIRQKYLNSKHNNNSVVFKPKQSNKEIPDKDDKNSNNNYLNKNYNSISIRNKYSKINMNNKNNIILSDNNNKNSMASSSKLSEDEKKNSTKKLSSSSICGMVSKTKTLFKRSTKDGHEQNDNNLEVSKIFNKTNTNFYKTQNNFMEKINKEEINKKQQEKKLGSSYIRNIMSTNKLDKDKKDKNEKNYFQSQKSSITYRTNNNISINNENKNKNNNISNKYSKYRKLYRNNTNLLNNNDINDNDNFNTSRYSKITESKNNNSNGKNEKITFKFPFHRRTYDTNINKNTNSYHTSIFKKK